MKRASKDFIGHKTDYERVSRCADTNEGPHIGARWQRGGPCEGETVENNGGLPRTTFRISPIVFSDPRSVFIEIRAN